MLLLNYQGQNHKFRNYITYRRLGWGEYIHFLTGPASIRDKVAHPDSKTTLRVPMDIESLKALGLLIKATTGLQNILSNHLPMRNTEKNKELHFT